MLSDNSGLRWIFSPLVCRFIPNLSLHHYEDIDATFTSHFPPSPIMVNHLFSYQRASFPFYLCEPLLKRFSSPIPEVVILICTLHAIHYLHNSATHSTFLPPYSCHIFPSHRISIYTGLGEKASFQAQLQERLKTVTDFFSSQKLRCEIQIITTECHINFLADTSAG